MKDRHEQIKELEGTINSTVQFTATCDACDHEHISCARLGDYDLDLVNFAENLHRRGWRLNDVVLRCPMCACPEEQEVQETRPRVADEREACAEIALAYGCKAAHLHYKQAAKDIAAAIRNRGKGQDDD